MMDEISIKEKEALLEIARKTLVGMEEREDFEPQNSDSLDFIEVSVWGIEKALTAAYLLGKESTK